VTLPLDLDHDVPETPPQVEVAPKRLSHATSQVSRVEPSAARAVTSGRETAATTDGTAARRTAELLRHATLAAHADEGAVASVETTPDEGLYPVRVESGHSVTPFLAGVF